MKKLLATISWLMFATAHGEAGQHTGVGGNPSVPPPQPGSIVLPGLVFQAIIIQPGVIIVLPDLQQAAVQDLIKDEPAESDEGDR